MRAFRATVPWARSRSRRSGRHRSPGADGAGGAGRMRPGRHQGRRRDHRRASRRSGIRPARTRSSASPANRHAPGRAKLRRASSTRTTTCFASLETRPPARRSGVHLAERRPGWRGAVVGRRTGRGLLASSSATATGPTWTRSICCPTWPKTPRRTVAALYIESVGDGRRSCRPCASSPGASRWWSSSRAAARRDSGRRCRTPARWPAPTRSTMRR